MIDGGNSRLRRVQRAGLAHGMHRHRSAQPAPFHHRRAELLGRVLVRRVQFAIDQFVFPRFVNLGEVRSLLVLLAHHLHQLLGGVGIIGIRKHVLRGVVLVRVLVAAEDVDGIPADAQPRPRNNPLVDGIANRAIGRARALGAHVALRGEAGHQVSLGSLFGQDHAPGNGLLHRLQVFSARVQEQMDMRIDHARHERHVAQIDGPRAGRMLN